MRRSTLVHLQARDLIQIMQENSAVMPVAVGELRDNRSHSLLPGNVTGENSNGSYARRKCFGVSLGQGFDFPHLHHERERGPQGPQVLCLFVKILTKLTGMNYLNDVLKN